MPFKKGTSGNPAGRKPGTLTKQDKLRLQIAEGVPSIIKAMMEKAEAGDTAAAKLLLDRTLPALRPTDAPVPLALGNWPGRPGGSCAGGSGGPGSGGRDARSSRLLRCRPVGPGQG